MPETPVPDHPEPSPSPDSAHVDVPTDGIAEPDVTAPVPVIVPGDVVVTAGVVSSFDLGDAGPYAIAIDPGGALWVTLVRTGELLRRSPDGTEQRFEVGERPGLVVSTADATWCAVSGEDRVVRISPDDQMSFIEVPGGPYGLCAADGRVWTTLMQGNALARLGASGIETEVALPVEGAFPAMITGHGDGSLWASLNQAGALVRRRPGGELELVGLPEGAAPVGIAAAGDHVWAADIARGRILQRGSGQHLREHALEPESRPHAVAADASGCWFTEWGANRLGRVDVTGRVIELDLSHLGEEPHGLALSGDGAVWVALESGTVAQIRA